MRHVTKQRGECPRGTGIEAGNMAELIAAIRNAKAYTHVHSSKWAGGEIRGQLH